MSGSVKGPRQAEDTVGGFVLFNYISQLLYGSDTDLCRIKIVLKNDINDAKIASWRHLQILFAIPFQRTSRNTFSFIRYVSGETAFNDKSIKCPFRLGDLKSVLEP